MSKKKNRLKTVASMAREFSRISILLCMTFFIPLTLYAINTPMSFRQVTQHVGNSEINTITNQNDFVSLIGKNISTRFDNSKQFFAQMDKLIQNSANNPNMAEAFNLLLTDHNVPEETKLTWLDKNLSKLPTPFFMLDAVLTANHNKPKAEQLYYLSDLMLLVDADRCADPTSLEGVTILKNLLVSMFFKNMLGIADLENPSDNTIISLKQLMLKMEKDNLPKIDKLFKMFPQNPQKPYWLAYHGIKPFLPDGANYDYFKPQSEWEKIKKNVIKEQIKYAQSRHNYL